VTVLLFGDALLPNIFRAAAIASSTDTAMMQCGSGTWQPPVQLSNPVVGCSMHAVLQ